MSMPGFTAEVSLYKTSKCYPRIRTGPRSAAQVVPQYVPPGGSFHPPDVRCGLACAFCYVLGDLSSCYYCYACSPPK
jgi:hypothetical protein